MKKFTYYFGILCIGFNLGCFLGFIYLAFINPTLLTGYRLGFGLGYHSILAGICWYLTWLIKERIDNGT